MAHITNYQFYQSQNEDCVLCAPRRIQSWSWIQGRQETIHVLRPLLRAQMPPQQRMCLMTTSSRCRRTIVRPITRATNHTHTAWQNEYFVLTDNNNFPDVSMRARYHGKGPADLGRSCGSKTLVPSHYGDDRAEPDQVILALKAWTIYKWQQNRGRFLQRS